MKDVRRALYGRAARTLSLGLAAALTLLILAYPRLLAPSGHEVPHGPLALLLLGISAAWVHGVGYAPQRAWLRPWVGPLAAWPAIAIASLLLVVR